MTEHPPSPIVSCSTMGGKHHLSRKMNRRRKLSSCIYTSTSGYFSTLENKFAIDRARPLNRRIPRNGVTSTSFESLRIYLTFKSKRNQVCIYVYPVADGRIVSPHSMENIPAGLLSSTMSGGGLTIVQYFPSTNCTRSSRYKVCLIGKHCSVDACGLPASRGRLRHRGGDEEGRQENPFQPLCST